MSFIEKETTNGEAHDSYDAHKIPTLMSLSDQSVSGSLVKSGSQNRAEHLEMGKRKRRSRRG
jgi:hypothetical protein